MAITTKEKIEVMQHFANGGKVECIERFSNGKWFTCDSPIWDWPAHDYRIKKEPRTFYLVLRANGEPVYSSLHEDKESAEQAASNYNQQIINGPEYKPYSVIKVQEVL